jgi:hypothetical protein
MKIVGCIALLVILATACGTFSTSKTTPIENDGVHLGEPFELGYKDKATIRDVNLNIQFDEILEDSRCPSKVNCVWSGLAQVGISVWFDGSQSNHLVLATANIPPDNSSLYSYRGYQMELKALEPYPEYPSEVVDKNSYRLTLIVTKEF